MKLNTIIAAKIGRSKYFIGRYTSFCRCI